MLHHFFSNYGIVFYYPNDLFYINSSLKFEYMAMRP